MKFVTEFSAHYSVHCITKSALKFVFVLTKYWQILNTTYKKFDLLDAQMFSLNNLESSICVVSCTKIYVLFKEKILIVNIVIIFVIYLYC
jgi:hypothetical protein